MVSNPTFDANAVNTDYDEWLTYDSSDSVLLNRATQGLYPPGSTFKIITALAYIRQNQNDYYNYSYNCDGQAYNQVERLLHVLTIRHMDMRI